MVTHRCLFTVFRRHSVSRARAALAVVLLAAIPGTTARAETPREYGVRLLRDAQSRRAAATGTPVHSGMARSGRIPAFARQYRTSCSTCHSMAPKLNVLGEAFRLNGYRLPENEQLIRREAGVPLGDPEWRELWPRSIWPGELPATPPVALRIESDVVRRPGGARASSWRWEFPHEVYLLAGANLGGSVAAFLEAIWSPDDGVELAQAKVKFQDPLPYVPRRLLNLWVGLQNAALLTLSDRQHDRAGLQRFLWQDFSIGRVELAHPSVSNPVRSPVTFSLVETRPTIELNGLPKPWAYYAVGLTRETVAADSAAADGWYYKARVKVGGLRLNGTYRPGAGPVPKGHGQLLDRSVVLEHFAYFGKARVAERAPTSYAATGVGARVLLGRLDVGGGYVLARFRRAWDGVGGDARHSAVFGKVDYLVFPWLMAYLKAESGELRLPNGATGSTPNDAPPPSNRWLPGVALLVRQNVRAVAEAEFPGSRGLVPGTRPMRGTGLGLRLDLSF